MKNQKIIRLLLYLGSIIAVVILFQGCATYKVSKVPPVTVPEIVQMSKDGVPSEEIIKEMSKSHTAYWLKADQLAKLKDEGVSDSVINYMEQTHIDAIQQNQRLEDSNYWWPGWDGFYYGGPAFGWPYDYWSWNWGPTIIFRNNEGRGVTPRRGRKR